MAEAKEEPPRRQGDWESGASGRCARAHPYRSCHIQPCLFSPLGALGVLAVEFPCLHAWRWPNRILEDGLSAVGIGAWPQPTPIGWSKTPPRPLREALRIRMGETGWESGCLFGRPPVRARPKRSMAKQDRGRGHYRSRYRKNAWWDSDVKNRVHNRIVAVLTQLSSEVW